MKINFGLCRISSGQNNYKTLNAPLYNILFVSVKESNLQLNSFFYKLLPAVVVLSALRLTQLLYIYMVKILKLLSVILIVKLCRGTELEILK